MIISSANIGRNDPVRYLADAGRCKFISSASVGQNDPRRYSDDAGRFKLIHNVSLCVFHNVSFGMLGMLGMLEIS